MGEHLKLAGDWNTVSQTNVEEMLYKIGAHFLIRKAAGHVKPSQSISFEGDKMKIITVTVKTTEKFIPLDGSEFSDQVFSKTYVCKVTVSEDGSITADGLLGDMGMKSVRKIDDAGQMVLTTWIDGVECVRVFARK